MIHPNTQKKLETVHPVLRQRIEILIENGQTKGFDIRVVSAHRNEYEQNALYAQGRKSLSEVNQLRSKASLGNISASENSYTVTNAKALQSNHNFGLAVDCVNFVNGKPDWNDLNAFRFIASEGKRLGLESGADWKFTDRPHLQLKGLSIKECASLYLKGGLKKVWSKMDEIIGGVSKPENLTPDLDDLIEFGDRGEAVTNLQNQLFTLGFIREDEIDGVFGKITKNAVIGFQRLNNLSSDGIVGDETKSALTKAIENLSVKSTEGEKAVDDTFSPVKTSHSAENEAKNDNLTPPPPETKEIPMVAPPGQKFGENLRSWLNWLVGLPLIGSLFLGIQNYFTSGEFDLYQFIQPILNFLITVFPNLTWILGFYTGYKTITSVVKQLGFQKQMKINADPSLNDIKVLPNPIGSTFEKVESIKDKITKIF